MVILPTLNAASPVGAVTAHNVVSFRSSQMLDTSAEVVEMTFQFLPHHSQTCAVVSNRDMCMSYARAWLDALGVIPWIGRHSRTTPTHRE